jgi:Fe-S-cluster containining protein
VGERSAAPAGASFPPGGATMGDDTFWRSGLRFSCTRCSRCCRHTPGYVFLSSRDLARLARTLHVTPEEFRRGWCRRVRTGLATRLSLLEKPNLDCILWADGGCSVYASRPLQCRSFPFWSANLVDRATWDEEAARCPGIGHGRLHSAGRIRRWLARRQLEGLLEG